eukprot:179304-Rhodomonas_salina.1
MEKEGGSRGAMLLAGSARRTSCSTASSSEESLDRASSRAEEPRGAEEAGSFSEARRWRRGRRTWQRRQSARSRGSAPPLARAHSVQSASTCAGFHGKLLRSCAGASGSGTKKASSSEKLSPQMSCASALKTPGSTAC